MHSDAIRDVAIVGYGPVGATLANLLDRLGLSVTIVEREAGVYHLARAGHFDAEVMRVFQSVGLADAIEPDTGVSTGMRFVDACGATLMEWKRGGAPGPQGWVSDYMFHQPTLERRLRAGLEGSPRVEARLQCDVWAVEDRGDHVLLKAEDTVRSAPVEIRARWVVGCDGARSLVRRTIGSSHVDLGFRQRWLVVDVQERRELGIPLVSIQQCDPERPMYAGSTAHGMHRWEVMVKDDDDATTITRHDRVWDFIERSVRPIRREDGEITRAVTYTFESLIAEGWRRGRLLIAGDAAHRTPPFLGQGMCAGIRDAANLAWKLAAVCRGRADPALLDTYESERRPHVEAFIRGAIGAGEFIQMSDPVKVAERDRMLRDSPRPFAPPDPALGPGLGDAYGTDGTGRLLAQPWLDGRRMDDVIGLRFAVVAPASALHGPLAAEALARRWPGLAVVALPPGHEGVLAPHGGRAVLMRPDRYVHGAFDDLAGLEALVRPVEGLLAVRPDAATHAA